MLVSFTDLNELTGWELYDYEHTQGGHTCQCCGHPIVHVYKIKKGSEVSELGSECVKEVASANGRNSMPGVSRLPKRLRQRVKIDKKSFTEEIDETLPY